MQVISINQSLNNTKYNIINPKVSNNISFKNDKTKAIQSAIELLTTNEAKEYLSSSQGQQFVKKLFHNTNVGQLESIEILTKALEEKKEWNKSFKEMVHNLAKLKSSKVFIQD